MDTGSRRENGSVKKTGLSRSDFRWEAGFESSRFHMRGLDRGGFEVFVVFCRHQRVCVGGRSRTDGGDVCVIFRSVFFFLFFGGVFFLGAGTGPVAVIILAEFPLGDAVHRHVLDRTNAINYSLKKKKKKLIRK